MQGAERTRSQLASWCAQAVRARSSSWWGYRSRQLIRCPYASLHSLSHAAVLGAGADMRTT